MASSITREEAERRLAELRDEERKLREAEAAAAAAEENERRELLTAIERAKQAERAEHLAAAQTHFVAVHQELVERLVDLAPACAAWEAARRGAMGSAGISGDEVGPVREIVASMGKLTRARENAPHMAAQRETQRRDDLRVAKLAEKKAAATAEARRELGW